MTTDHPLSLFISSKMEELADERRAVQAALKEYEMHGWLWEAHAGARPEPIRSTYLKEVAACDIYIGLFWLGYGQYTIEEYEQARKLHKPCLIYEKYVNVEQRGPELAAFLQRLQQVESPEGLTVCRFETPEQLAAQVQKDVRRLLTTRFRESRQQPSSPSLVWNVPYRPNPFFTGRETLLKQLQDNLPTTRATALTQAQAISGLGGIGKTQIAVEYAYRHRRDYHFVLWASATTRETLITEFIALASALDLPEKNEQDQNITIAAVKRWLATHDQWLLILDNADDLDLAREFLPTGDKGHLLLTTRAQALGSMAQSIEVENMEQEEGTLLLLRRAKVLGADASLDQASQQDRAKAEAIVRAMDGLPLALDQAGAYIEETGCSVAAYLDRYLQREADLLKRRGSSGTDHPEPVATTWSLSFEQVERLSPAAADLLRFCAFLSPDAIPEEMIVEGTAELGPLLQPVADDPPLLDEAMATLRRFSFVQRNRDDHTLSLHRLVQAVLKASMNDEIQRAWAERTVRAVNRAFPYVEVETWPQCLRYLPHAQACADLISKHSLAFPEGARLLNQAASYLQDHALYEQAEPLYQRALQISEQVLGATHPDTATSLNNLAVLYRAQGKYKQAEPLYQRALAICEQVLEPDHPDTASSLNNLAGLYRAQGNYEQAEPLLKRALQISEQVLGATHPLTATSLNNLAVLYEYQGKYEQAEPLLKRALAICEQVLEPDHPDTAISLNRLAILYYRQGKYEQAVPLCQRALAIQEKLLGPDHPSTGSSLSTLALLYDTQGKYEQAEPLYQRALQICEQVLGPTHPDTASSLNNLAALYHAQGNYEQAEPLLKRALQIREQVLEPDHPDTAISLNNLAELYRAQGNYEQAEPLYRRALAIYEQVLGPTHPDTATVRENYTDLLREMKQKKKK